MRRNAFTLIEMLIVITIIGILAGLSLAVISGVTTNGNTVKSQTLMNNVSALLETYKTTNGFYPGSKADPLNAGVKAWDPNNYTYVRCESGWSLDILVNNSKALEEDLKKFSPGNLDKGLIDGFKNRVFYLESRSYPTTPDEQPRMDSFQLWSTGKNGKNDAIPQGRPYASLPWGGGDDLVNWQK